MMQVADINRYLESDVIFNKINKLFISLDPIEVKGQNPHLNEVFTKLIQLMQRKSPLFDKTFQRIAWVGSFYKNTRTTEPGEYDVNFVINLPIKEKDVQFSSDRPGYIKLRTTWRDRDVKNLNMDSKAYQEMNSFIDDGSYLNQEKFRTWMEGIFSKVARETSGYDLIKLDDYPPIRLKKSGPAFTLQLQIPPYGRTIDIDVVPALAFSTRNPPPRCSKKHVLKDPRYQNTFWYAIPKPLNNQRDTFDMPHRYWRLSFYDFEKDILTSHNYGRVKPVIRHLKKFRDTLGWKSIASYYLEMLCLQKLEIFHIKYSVSLTSLFFTMLQNLYIAFRDHSIEFYWDEDLNMLEHIGRWEMENMEKRLCRIINDIVKNIKDDPYAIAKWLLNKEELIALRLSNQPITRSLSEESASEPESEPDSSNQWKCVIA